jgi:hypothetical protein
MLKYFEMDCAIHELYITPSQVYVSHSQSPTISLKKNVIYFGKKQIVGGNDVNA